jgi:hypothetical protein
LVFEFDKPANLSKMRQLLCAEIEHHYPMAKYSALDIHGNLLIEAGCHSAQPLQSFSFVHFDT